MVMGMVHDKDTAAMFEAEVEHGATEHVTIVSVYQYETASLVTLREIT